MNTDDGDASQNQISEGGAPRRPVQQKETEETKTGNNKVGVVDLSCYHPAGMSHQPNNIFAGFQGVAQRQRPDYEAANRFLIKARREMANGKA